jgi:mono/diheme cytochrome c family protein
MKTAFTIALLTIMLSSAGDLNARPAPVPQGKRVFEQWCAACHGPGVRTPGTSALAAKYGKDQPAVLEQRKDLSPDIIKYFVRQGVSIMPSFRKTEITDAELNALADYLARTPGSRKK